MTADRSHRDPDGLGRLELVGLGIWFGALLGLAVAQLVAAAHDESAPSPTTWAVGVATAVVVGVTAVLLIARDWRRYGGRRLQRRGRHVWSTGRLPDDLPGRIAVLRDLERRERKLQRAGIPVWALAAFWTVLVAVHLASSPGPAEAAVWLGLWASFLVTGLIDLVDRRRRPRLRRLIAELRLDPVPALPTAVR